MGRGITISPLDHTYLYDFTYSVFLTNLGKAISIIKEYVCQQNIYVLSSNIYNIVSDMGWIA